MRYFVVWGPSNVWLIKAHHEQDAVERVDTKGSRSRVAHLKAREATPADVRRLQDADGTKVPSGAEKWAAES